MWGTTVAGSRSTVPGHSPSPSSGPENGSVEPSKSTCIPTYTPSTGRPPPSRTPMMRGPVGSGSPPIQAWKLPTPGTNSPSAPRAALESAGQRHLRPDPFERAHGGAHVATAVVEDDDVLGHRAPFALGMPTTRGSRAITGPSTFTRLSYVLNTWAMLPKRSVVRWTSCL